MSGHRPRAVLVLLAAVLSVSLAASPADAVAHDSALQAFDLRAGNVTTPLAASSAPALSWKLRSGRPGARQTAYRILVATDPRLLTEKRADVWDSGKVASAGSVGVPYRGPVAAAGKRNYWTVEVWGADSGSPAVAAPTWWETGPAQPADWGGAAWRPGHRHDRRHRRPPAHARTARYVTNASPTPNCPGSPDTDLSVRS
ncbi:hypothetical protein ABZ342_42915 [Amycolatopsis sp. NPDC005961]|uniref:glycoside hydrolase family 78 protein n=1 Tax=Amycolatopsis sp. NPDC005961 TaxID=3156720 RepID=UPI0033EC4BA5